MAIPKFEENLDIIANMGDDPKSDNGLTTQEFKMEFDKAGNLIKDYINNVLLPNLNITVDMEAIEKYIKNNALLLTGGIMRGNIDMDGNRISYLPTPVNDSDAATKEFVETLVYTFAIDKYTGIGELFFDDATEQSVKNARRAIKKEIFGYTDDNGVKHLGALEAFDRVKRSNQPQTKRHLNQYHPI